MDKIKLMIGDNIQSLKKLEDNSVDSVVTDPPYALTPSKNAKGGFMGKLWDAEVPSVEFWREVYRVLKPGGHALSFGGTRTYHRMVVNIEDAGFEIRDQIMWLYGSGFPKSHNIGKAVDKLEGNERKVVGKLENYQDKRSGKDGNPAMMELVKPRIDIDITKGTSEYEGWGTALKPANEPICVARKPLSEKSVAENVLKWGTGGINVDGCRVGSEGGTRKENIKDAIEPNAYGGGKGIGYGDVVDINEGRFPANLILECICDEVIKGEKGEVKKSGGSRNGLDITHEWGYGEINRTTFTDKGDIHTNPMCPCRLLDEQSGVSKSSKLNQPLLDITGGSYNNAKGNTDTITERGFNDKGGASRFFYIAKVSKKERNMGLDGFEETTSGSKGHGLDRRCSHCKTSMLKPENCKCENPDWITPPKKNTHPTVKPVALMTYLCRLITPQGGIVLDPFMGSGSTGIAARLEGFDFIGMEMDEDYVKIASARIENFEKYREFLNKK